MEDHKKSSRKRSHKELASLTETSLSESELNTTSQTMKSVIHEHIQSLSLEAIFHPKFENENRAHAIRNEMKEKVQHGNQGYLEVSLKHSGNLLLWSGGQRYYSKNATSNAFTFVGEMLLRQHFCRAWFSEKSQAGADEMMMNMYQECSDYVEENRLTLSFEAVTAVLGQHGDVPNKDFLILTAVADKATRRFYSTVEVLELAQRFRLPHNDVWVYSTVDAVDQLFDLYDTTRETGLADGTIALLNESSNAHVSSMYPHVDFQGNILEGIVIRYVAYKQDEKEQQDRQLQSLAKRSAEILRSVPADTPPSFELMKGTAGTKVLSENVRTVLAQCIEEGGYTNLIPRLGDGISEILETSDPSRRKIEREAKATWDVPSIAKYLFSMSNINTETRLIASLIEKLDKSNAAVNYSVHRENAQRLLCTIHILHDSTFVDFQKKMKPGDMHLYRGFSIELSTFAHQGKAVVPNSNESSAIETDDTDSASDVSLMLKMKFLPYMVRTFCCRNGLKIIKTHGRAAFSSFTTRLMKKWGISQEGQARWQPFFWAWGQYVHDCMTDAAGDHIDKSLPPMDEAFYLDHLDHFVPLFEKGFLQDMNDAENVQEASGYRAMVVVVSPTKEKAEIIAGCISQQLGGLNLLTDMSSLKEPHLIDMQAPRGGGLVVSASIDQGVGKLRRFVKEYGNSISIVLVDCDDASIEASLLPNTRKLKGMVTGWEKTRVALVQHVDSLSLVDSDTNMTTDTVSTILPNEKFENLLSMLRNVSDRSLPPVDNRTGLLIFFPCLPGCGKSALSGTVTQRLLTDALAALNKEHEAQNPVRTLHSLVGDKINAKYWTEVKKKRSKDPSGILIADKNAPKNAWPIIGESVGNGLVIPALPKGAVCTTSIEGIILPSGDNDPKVRHHYPFSLHYLAVCMARVLARPANSHVGGLDSSLKHVCLVIVKFFCLYRNVSSDDFLDTISAAIGRSGASCASSPIEIPFFASTDPPHLPQDLMQVLTEAIQVHYGYERNSKEAETLVSKDPLIQSINCRLRETIQNHTNFLFALGIDENISRAVFTDAIKSYVKKVSMGDGRKGHIPAAKPASGGQVRLVSIDVPNLSIHKALCDIARKDNSILQALEVMGADIGDSHFGANFVQQTHVTMAFCERTSQDEIRSTFEALVGQSVVLEGTGLLYNDRIAAIAVQIPKTCKDGSPLPGCKNPFAHITLWKKGARSVDSNMLPQQVNEGGAFHDVFEKPIQLEGKLSFWFTNE